jgi:hypothetical protein
MPLTISDLLIEVATAAMLEVGGDPTVFLRDDDNYVTIRYEPNVYPAQALRALNLGTMAIQGPQHLVYCLNCVLWRSDAHSSCLPVRDYFRISNCGRYPNHEHLA